MQKEELHSVATRRVVGMQYLPCRVRAEVSALPREQKSVLKNNTVWIP